MPRARPIDRPTVVVTMVMAALLASMVSPQASLADDEVVERIVRLEATVNDDAGSPVPIEVCVEITFDASPFVVGEDLDEIFVRESLELPPGTEGFEWEHSFELPLGAQVDFATLAVFVSDCDTFRYQSAFESFVEDVLFEDPLEATFELRPLTLVRAETTTDDGQPLAADQCVQLYQYDPDGQRTAASVRTIGARALTLRIPDPGEPFRYGLDACRFPSGDVGDFPFQPVFFDAVSDLADATQVIVEDRELVDLGTFVLREPGDEPEPGDPDDEGAGETVGGFGDVPAGYIHAEGIVWLVDQGITTGLADGTFGPGNPVTRAQMATFLDRALNLDDADDPDGFPDVPTDFVHADAIDRLVAAGITTGLADGTFGPGNPVTRGQMATFLFRALS